MSPTAPTKLSDEELAVDISEIPLPPEALWDELDNTPQPQKPEPKRDVATLDFVAGAPTKTVTLAHPFRLDGTVVERVTVRMLSVAETGDLISALPDDALPDRYDFYAAMTGLSSSVIRALPVTDGEQVTGAAHDFLPRFMRAGG